MEKHSDNYNKYDQSYWQLQQQQKMLHELKPSSLDVANIYKNDVLQNADKHRLLTLPNKEHKGIRWRQQQMSQK